MLKFDKQENKYTWKREWNIPYESIWGRIEKFRSINVLDSKHMDRNVISIGEDRPGAIFSNELLVYRKNPYKKSKPCNIIFDIDKTFLNTFVNLESVLDRRIRFCSRCMRVGYHSLLHQLRFFDYCFIHKNLKLKYRCDCSDTYVLRRKMYEKADAFQCEICSSKISDTPLIVDGIINSWWGNQVKTNIVHTNKYKNIYIADILYEHWNNKEMYRPYAKLSNKQKSVLQDVTLTGKTEMEPRFIIEKSGFKQPFEERIVMSELINRYIIDKYSRNTILKHFGHISNRIYRYYVGEYDSELLSLFFLIRELQNEKYVDRLRYNQCIGIDGNLTKKYVSDCSFIIDFINDAYYNMKMNKNEYPEMYNIILTEYTRARFDYIYSCFKNNYPESYPNASGAELSYTNWDYPVYVLIRTQDDKVLIF